jgi:hypothetical protein
LFTTSTDLMSPAIPAAASECPTIAFDAPM